MILLITPQSRGPEFAALVHEATSQETHWAQTVQDAATRLREQPYSTVVIDQFVLETEPDESDQMIEHLGTAFPVYINFAVTGLDRLIREVRSALHRRKREESAARRAVAEQLHSEMGETPRPCFFPASWRCPYPIFRALPLKRFAPSIFLRGNYGCVSRLISSLLAAR